MFKQIPSMLAFCALIALSCVLGCGQTKPIEKPDQAPSVTGATNSNSEAEKHNKEAADAADKAKTEVEKGKAHVQGMQNENKAPTEAFKNEKKQADTHLDAASTELTKAQDALAAEKASHATTKQELAATQAREDERTKYIAGLEKDRDDWKKKALDKTWDRYHAFLEWGIVVLALIGAGIAAYLRLVEQSIVRMACAIFLTVLVVGCVGWIDLNLERIMEVIGWTLVVLFGAGGIGTGIFVWLHLRKHEKLGQIASDAVVDVADMNTQVTSFVTKIANDPTISGGVGEFKAMDAKVLAAAKFELGKIPGALEEYAKRFGIPSHVLGA